MRSSGGVLKGGWVGHGLSVAEIRQKNMTDVLDKVCSMRRNRAKAFFDEHIV